MNDIILTVSHLTVSFTRYQSSLVQNEAATVKDVSLQIKKGQIVAVVGASGAGKSLLAHSILGILPKNASVTGDECYFNEVLTNEKKEKYRGGEIALIPQSVSYLDPILKVKKQLSFHHSSKKELLKTLEKLGLKPSVLELYPYQLSGGMARRVLFATALFNHPKLIVADEPTPGMDLTQAIAALSILKEEVKKEQSGLLLITHDIDLALSFADEIVFFEDGKTIDCLTPEDFKNGPKETWQDFTKKMWHALPQNGFKG